MTSFGLQTLAARVAEARRWRRTLNAVGDLDERTLRDIGFSRDYRGSIIRLPEGLT